MLRTAIRPVVAACLALAVVAATAAPVAADPLADKRAQAAKVQAQVSTLDAAASLADENYNVARDRFNRLDSQVHAVQRKVARLDRETLTLQAALGKRADAMYRGGGPMAVFEMLLSTKSIAEFNAVLDWLTAISRQDADTVARLKAARAEADAARAVLVVARAKAARQKAAMASAASAVRAQLASRQALLSSLNADIRKIIADAQAREAALARARWGGTIDLGGNPPTSSKGAAAVWYAEKALGRPYEWAASGPGSFDCSGLVMWAYSHVGISLPHSSRDQIGVGTRVGRSYLQPGDLVFFGSPIHHVGMYVGNGTFIEAPHTGANVRFATLADRGDYAGACRP